MLAVDQTVMQNLIQDSLRNAAEMEIDSDNNKEGAGGAGSGAGSKPEEKHDEPMDGAAEESDPHPEHMHN